VSRLIPNILSITCGVSSAKSTRWNGQPSVQKNSLQASANVKPIHLEFIVRFFFGIIQEKLSYKKPLKTDLQRVMTLPTIDRPFLETSILPRVHKPGRYLGMEFGAFRKPVEQAKVLMTMIFPDLYEIGVSNYGHKMLYSLVNNQSDYLCDRAYAPAKDMRELLKEHNIPLYGIETLLPLKEMDLLAFTLQYELNYTSILGVLEAAQIPFRSENRLDNATPILIAGGPGSGNPMPLSPFFDAFIIGDGEDVLLEILDILKQAKADDWEKTKVRQKLSTLDGVFVPGISTGARKRIVDISQQEVELAPLVPFIQTVHDRVTIEARRGCDRMCRFCQPCFINLPVREQKIPKIREQSLKEIAKTGYEECSLLSLSIADYSQLKPLIHEVADALNEKGVSLSLPSQRADRFDLEVAEAVQQVRKSTLTFAPEAGTARLRAVLNKNLTEKEILDAVTSSYQAGWNKVKLYFMIGLPTETDVDLDGIVDLVGKMQIACAGILRDEKKSRKSVLAVNVTFSNFVPKPHTPFQWVAQASMAELNRKRDYLKQTFRSLKGVKLNFTDPEISKLEAVISKGDARMADVIEKAYRKGAYLDAWEENLLFAEWFESLQEMGIDPDVFTATAYTRFEDALPWDGINVGLERDWLMAEYQKSIEETSSEPCFVGCSACGVCPDFDAAPVFMKPSEMKDFVPSEKQMKSKAELFPLPAYKVRLMLQKAGDLKFISHLDWLRMLQRAIFRAQLPIAYSQGFNPTPNISFGPALPLFVEGLEEYIDLEMVEKIPNLQERLNEQLPESGKILQSQWIPLQTSSLDKMLRYVKYSGRGTCSFSQRGYTLSERVDELRSQSNWFVEIEKAKTRQRIDIKPLIETICLNSSDEILFTIKIDRQGPQVKPHWFLNLIDSQMIWDLKRLKVGLSESNSFVTI
jgi:radical SAM-linked protein